MVQQQLAVNRPDWEGMTVRIAVPITADASSLVTLHVGTSCEQGVNGQLTHQPKTTAGNRPRGVASTRCRRLVQEDRFLVFDGGPSDQMAGARTMSAMAISHQRSWREQGLLAG